MVKRVAEVSNGTTEVPHRISEVALPTTQVRNRTAGFTLVEVVVALLVLEVSVLGALATLAYAAELSRRAETLERASGRVESVLDSLALGARVDTVTAATPPVRIRWTVDATGRVDILAMDETGTELVRASTTVPLLGAGSPATPAP